MKPEPLGVKKRSIVMAGRRTSVSLEEPFWKSLKEIAASKDIALGGLIMEIHGTRSDKASLSSALRLFVLDYYRGGDRQCPQFRD